jgi:prolyl 4-hydroxylase
MLTSWSRYFHTHTDYFEKISAETARLGGQRLFSGLVYLTDEFSGGETEFPALNFSYTPRKGTMLFWRNVDAAITPIPAMRHAGRPVSEGRKLALNLWVLQRPFEVYRSSLL